MGSDQATPSAVEHLVVLRRGRARTRAVRSFAVLGVALSFAVGCSASESGRAAAPPLQGAVTPHLILISIDGLRADAPGTFGARLLLRLARDGAVGVARTVPSGRTLPAHTSMLSGVSEAAHGVDWNRDERALRGFVRIPTVFTWMAAHGLEAAMFVGKSKLLHLAGRPVVRVADGPAATRELRRGRSTVARVERHLERGHRPHLLFVHLAEPDVAGHDAGWMTPEYAAAVHAADSLVGHIVQAATRAFGPGGFTVIVTADHGGAGREHRGGTPEELMVPWIAWGRGITPGTTLDTLRIEDTAATVAVLMGMAPPVPLEGAVPPMLLTAAR